MNSSFTDSNTPASSSCKMCRKMPITAPPHRYTNPPLINVSSTVQRFPNVRTIGPGGRVSCRLRNEFRKFDGTVKLQPESYLPFMLATRRGSFDTELKAHLPRQLTQVVNLREKMWREKEIVTDAMSQVIYLLQGHPKLIVAFSRFLPKTHDITVFEYTDYEGLYVVEASAQDDVTWYYYLGEGAQTKFEAESVGVCPKDRAEWRFRADLAPYLFGAEPGIFEEWNQYHRMGCDNSAATAESVATEKARRTVMRRDETSNPSKAPQRLASEESVDTTSDEPIRAKKTRKPFVHKKISISRPKARLCTVLEEYEVNFPDDAEVTATTSENSEVSTSLDGSEVINTASEKRPVPATLEENDVSSAASSKGKFKGHADNSSGKTQTAGHLSAIFCLLHIVRPNLLLGDYSNDAERRRTTDNLTGIILVALTVGFLRQLPLDSYFEAAHHNRYLSLDSQSTCKSEHDVESRHQNGACGNTIGGYSDSAGMMHTAIQPALILLLKFKSAHKTLLHRWKSIHQAFWRSQIWILQTYYPSGTHDITIKIIINIRPYNYNIEARMVSISLPTDYESHCDQEVYFCRHRDFHYYACE
ncbi:hypothetical protein RUND412_002344 [Rhizina undulata]